VEGGSSCTRTGGAGKILAKFTGVLELGALSFKGDKGGETLGKLEALCEVADRKKKREKKK